MLRPPERFVKQLRAYDPKLLVGWNAGLGRWIIGRPRMLGPGIAHIMTVQNPDGTYRPLDQRTVDRLKLIDSWRVGKEEQVRQLEATWEAEEKADDKALEARIEQKLEKLHWALKRDVTDWNLGTILKQEVMAAEQKAEKKLIELAI